MVCIATSEALWLQVFADLREMSTVLFSYVIYTVFVHQYVVLTW